MSEDPLGLNKQEDESVVQGKATTIEQKAQMELDFGKLHTIVKGINKITRYDSKLAPRRVLDPIESRSPSM